MQDKLQELTEGNAKLSSNLETEQTNLAATKEQLDSESEARKALESDLRASQDKASAGEEALAALQARLEAERATMEQKLADLTAASEGASWPSGPDRRGQFPPRPCPTSPCRAACCTAATCRPRATSQARPSARRGAPPRTASPCTRRRAWPLRGRAGSGRMGQRVRRSQATAAWQEAGDTTPAAPAARGPARLGVASPAPARSLTAQRAPKGRQDDRSRLPLGVRDRKNPQPARPPGKAASGGVCGANHVASIQKTAWQQNEQIGFPYP